jgi:trans-aconitate methyltransferase
MCGFCDAYEIISKKTAAAFKYEGFDYSEAMVELTKTNYPAINIWVQDITQFKSKKKYDVIFVIGGLHHIYKYADSAVQNLFNSLKENGKIVIFEPVNNNWLLKKIREIIYKKNSFFDEETEKAFTTNELNNLFLSRNMKIEDTLFPGLLS